MDPVGTEPREGPVPRRNAIRSRAAIMDAAEALFAERGYPGVSLQEVAHRAGVARATPSYFFGSKEPLYGAVLARVFEDSRAVIAESRGRAAAAGGGPEARVAAAVGGFLDFLAARPSFVRLVEREAMAGGELLGERPPHLAFVQEGIAAVADDLASGGFRPVDPVQLLLSFVGMCWFPFAQAEVLARALGTDPRDPAFLAARRRHVVDLLLHGIRQV